MYYNRAGRVCQGPIAEKSMKKVLDTLPASSFMIRVWTER
jgi:hypothetical protein